MFTEYKNELIQLLGITTIYINNKDNILLCVRI